jgi:hypothetical protein
MASFLSTPGPAGTIQIGTVTKLAPEAQPTVVNVGQPWAAILNIGLPQGETGTVSVADQGSATAPGIRFENDADTGFYQPAPGQIGISTNGNPAVVIDENGKFTILGDLAIQGVTTTVNTQNLVVKDHTIEIGVVTTPSDTTATNGGITLYGTTNKTLHWISGSWTSSENIDLAAGKRFSVAGIDITDDGQY